MELGGRSVFKLDGINHTGWKLFPIRTGLLVRLENAHNPSLSILNGAPADNRRGTNHVVISELRHINLQWRPGALEAEGGLVD